MSLEAPGEVVWIVGVYCWWRALRFPNPVPKYLAPLGSRSRGRSASPTSEVHTRHRANINDVKRGLKMAAVDARQVFYRRASIEGLSAEGLLTVCRARASRIIEA